MMDIAVKQLENHLFPCFFVVFFHGFPMVSDEFSPEIASTRGRFYGLGTRGAPKFAAGLRG